MPYVCEVLFESCILEWREIEILMLLLIFIGVKTRKAATWLQFVNTMCTFSKVANIILYWREGPLHTLLFSLLWFLHFVFLPQPVYKGPQKIQIFRASHLENEIKRDDRITWLVYFHANWSPPCTDFDPVFAELSNKYGDLNNLRFAKFNCNLFPEVANRFSISTSSLSKQLPTVILFQKCQEIKRRPFIDSKGTVYKFIFSYENMVKEFDLNKIYFECKQELEKLKPNETPKQQSKQEKKEN